MTKKCIEAPAIKPDLPIAIGIDTIFTIRYSVQLTTINGENHSATCVNVNKGG